IYFTSRDDEPVASAPPPPPPAPTPMLEEPPPPPPPVEELPEAGAEEQPKTTVKRPTGGGGCAGECTGTASANLRSALRAKAGQGRGCYERALRQNAMLQGRLVVTVRIGPGGQVCSARVSENALGDPSVAQCVLQSFRAGRYPAPEGGCVEVAVPMNFVPKT